MKIVTVVGARPQFIKAAAVSRAIKSYNAKGNTQIEEIIVHTGQHYDYNMSEVFFDELEIPKPNYNLSIGSAKHGTQTGRMLEAIESVLIKESPNCVLVYGDTNSTIAAALAAAKLHIPIAHVEAGLRSYNKKMPEEVNRVLTDHISSFLFCPTLNSVKNLRLEGIEKGVYNVGDVMYDCILFYKSMLKQKSTMLDNLNVKYKDFALATVHRAENTDSPEMLVQIFNSFNEISKEIPILVALHPRTKKFIEKYNIRVSHNVRILEPLSYLQMIDLEVNAKVILTDSGGVQKEAFFVETPCITLRNETEWVETVECGANILSGASYDRIISAFRDIEKMNKNNVYNSNIFGNGNSSEEIIRLLI